MGRPAGNDDATKASRMIPNVSPIQPVFPGPMAARTIPHRHPILLARLLRGLICLFLWLAFSPPVESLTAAVLDLPAEFQQANRWYEEGKYLDAITAYQAIIQSGHYSAPLFFNLGNAFFKHGQIGRARACFWLAREMTPRDPAAKNNLRLTVQSAGAESRAWWENPISTLRFLSLNEWTVLTAFGLWSWFGLLMIGTLWPDLKPKLGRGRACALGFLLLAASAFLITLYDRYGVLRAVVIQSTAELRRGPIKESQVFASLNDGAMVKVLDRQDQWVEVSYAAKGIGWLPNDHVAILQPGVFPTNLLFRSAIAPNPANALQP